MKKPPIRSYKAEVLALHPRAECFQNTITKNEAGDRLYYVRLRSDDPAPFTRGSTASQAWRRAYGTICRLNRWPKRREDALTDALRDVLTIVLPDVFCEPSVLFEQAARAWPEVS